MNTNNCLIVIILIISLSSCNYEKKVDRTANSVSAGLQVDHLNIWVENPKITKKRLTDIGFTSVPNSLSPIHKGQGTAGRYFHFSNNYLELIFVYDQKELEENNKKNKDLDFIERANFKNNGASPFSIALKVKDYNIANIPFEKIKYHQSWMEENENIYSAKNSKTHLNEPSVFVVYPKIESGTFESLNELEQFPNEDASWKEFFKHPNGAKRITNIIITSSDLDSNTKTVRAVNEIQNLTVKKGSEHLLELYFDDNIQEKSYDLRLDLPLIIYL